MKISDLFVTFSKKVSYFTGHPAAFVTALGIVAVWGITGPVFEFNDTWQLVINTGTTIVTFLMVFLIQSTQNRDTTAIQLKLDELIRVTEGAHLVLMDLEELSESDLDGIREHYEKIARLARKDVKKGKSDIGRREVDITQICLHEAWK